LFVAPKDLDVLRAARPPLDGLVDFGWFSVVAKPLFVALRYIYDHWLHNWGWAIIILTVLINVAMFPLKLKSIRSAQEMQKIGPIVKGIQEKYKQYKFNDPRKQRMNEEIMKLYKEHGVNPLGGCLPMVLQLPLLYGFYRVLDQAIELRHAPWFGWIKDLSMPDHLYILPAIMVVTMFVLQKMTPMAATDPSQQRMMMIMPLAFGFIFFRLASGLNLYYLTANIVGIAQQVLINRLMPVTPPAPPGAPPSGAPPARSRPSSRKPVSVSP
jgi:YidC/Oxa1 family membrane protein insertase